MNTAEFTIVILGILALGSTAGFVFLLLAKAKAEAGHKAELGHLQSTLNEAATKVGHAEELSRTLESVRQDKTAAEKRVDSLASDINRLTDELSSARTERDNARQNAADLVQAERVAFAAAVERERTACANLIQKEKESCGVVIAAKDSEIGAKDTQIENLKEFIEKANETLGNQFKYLSQETLRDVAAQFEKSAKKTIEDNAERAAQSVRLDKEQIENMLQPVGISLAQLNRQVKETNEKRGEAEAVLMDKIKDFAGANEKLANALNKPVIRGSFAETKLESLLEAAGLVKGEDFELQVPISDGDQTRIVDALVNMPQGKKLVIDSKNLLVPFVAFANAPEAERPAAQAEFQRAFRSTLKGLGLKDYAKHWAGIDAVLMFLPDEGMYMAAIESDRQLIATMYEHRVFTVSPVSLQPIVKSVAYILGLERQNRDTQTIVDAGRDLYESLGVILGKVKRLGDKLDDGVEAYNGVIASFEGNLLPKARQLHRLGVLRGAPHKQVSVVTVDRREFKDRTLKELSEPAQLALSQTAGASVGSPN